MDKATLKEIVAWNSMGTQGSSEAILTAVDLYTSAIIAQSKCSTLRELLVQQLNRTPKGGGDTHKLVRNSLNTKRKTLSSIIKLIDELQPVA